jgi:histone H3/H4
LKRQTFQQVTAYDAAVEQKELRKKYDAVLSNPPFGRFDEDIIIDGVRIKYLDHAMILHALSAMKDNGKAAFVMGGHLKFDRRGRISVPNGRYFFNYLYSHYNVRDMIQVDGSSLYARQGTGQDVTLLLVEGHKKLPSGAAPMQSVIQDQEITSFDALYERVTKHFVMKQNIYHLKRKAKSILDLLATADLGAPYEPRSNSCFVLDTEVPDSMAFEMHAALDQIREAVGGDVDNFVRHRLGYSSKGELCKSLSAEQTDAVAMAIYNIEAKDQGCIIGDQTGIGKGRVAASIVRYAIHQGMTPIFITEKANLFSDLYRDLIAIGGSHLRPFIVNSRESKTNIKDGSGKILYKAPPKSEQTYAFETGEIEDYDFIMATYSQFNASLMNSKKAFLLDKSEKQIIIMDESHNASGASNTGVFLQDVVKRTKATIFLSATFAKRPENMPVYALKTAISDANMSSDSLVSAIASGGVPLQEIVASQLVAEGQMIRRQRSYEGVDVEYRTLYDKKKEHYTIADRITEIMREIIAFQANYVTPLIDEKDEIYAKEGKEIRRRGGTSRAGVDNTSYFSKIFNVINQMLFSIKADDVADVAIEQLKKGKKPIIAFASTMGSFLNQILEEEGIVPGQGDKISTDFALVLQNGLDGVMRYTETDHNGEKYKDSFSPDQLGVDGEIEYNRITKMIESVASGIFISPIDIIVEKIQNAGYSTHEVTGRTLQVIYDVNKKRGTVERRRKINVNDAFADFNNNEVDVLLINQSGSTGASAQAMPTDKVPKEKVKPRVMIVLQMELNVDTEIQKRGRIYRTGQIYMPSYIYINSAIPAEQRMMMMLRQKLKSLDANTSSDQDQNKKMIDVPDFLNKYGDGVIAEYLQEDRSLHRALGKPDLNGSGGETAHRASGRIAVMPTEVQEAFYKEVTERYLERVEYLKQTGEYDLEVENLDLKATTLSKKISVAGNGGFSRFGTDTYLTKVEVNNLRKPFSADDLKKEFNKVLNGQTPEQYARAIVEGYQEHAEKVLKESIQKANARFNEDKKRLPNKKDLQKIKKEEGETMYQKALAEAEQNLEQSRTHKINDLEQSHKGKSQQFSAMVHFFKVGRKLLFPKYLNETVLTTFLGFDINLNKPNPYAPSAVKLRFAFASSMKFLPIPSSYQPEINSIRGASMDVSEVSQDQLLEEWTEAIQRGQQDRVIRYMVTGNLLQGLGRFFSGKLISYTTDKGAVEKGLFMPEDFSPQMDDEIKGVVVPLGRAIGHIQSQPIGRMVNLSHAISIVKQYSGYVVRFPASKKRGGEFYLNKELIALTEDKQFEKVSTSMRGTISVENIVPFLNYLESRFKVSIVLSEHEFEQVIQHKLDRSGKVKPIDLPPAESEKDTRILKLKARAVIIKLKLWQELNKKAS